MDKQQLLQELKNSVAAGEISQAEIMESLGVPKILEAPVLMSAKHVNLAQIMYYLGGAIVFLGIAILLGQNWDYFNPGVKIFVTLGSAIAAYVVAVLLLNYPNLKGPAQAFFLLAGLVMPLGLYVSLDKMGMDVGSNSSQLLIWLILFVAYIVSFFRFKLTVLSLFAVIFSTVLFHFIISLLTGSSLSYDSHVYEYEAMAVGLAYLCLGYYLSETYQKVLTGFLYGFGVLIFLGSTMTLGGWNPNQNTFWELIYPFLVFGIIFLSVYLKSKSFLVFGSLFLVGYIFKLTGEYFSDSMGWPLALMIAGFLVMLVGYYAVKLGKKYFPKAA